MKHTSTITILTLLIAVLAAIATTTGVISNDGPGRYEYNSIRGKSVTIYGRGLYKHMSAEVAPQGIAQDYITLFAAVPLLIASLIKARRGSLKGHYLLSGTLGYFLVTYLFYTVMGMYNQMFLVYVSLMGASFFAFILTLFSLNMLKLPLYFKPTTPIKSTGAFLILISASIALLWLSIVVPPLLEGTVIPVQVEHYTTLIVQGVDLGILLPAAIICGYLWLRKKPIGYLLTPVYFIFLSLLMTALTAKVIGMSTLGYNVIPVIYVIPAFNLLTVICTIGILRSISKVPVKIKQQYHEKAMATKDF
jgi:hypothetical protein